MTPNKETPIGTPLKSTVKGWGTGPFVYMGNGRGGNTIVVATKKDGLQQARASDFAVDSIAAKAIGDFILK